MITFTQTGTINAPAEKVFGIIADPLLIPQWRTDIPKVSQVSGPTRAGTTFTEEVRFMGTKQLRMKVTECVPGKKIVIEALSGMPMLPKQSFTFVPEGNRTLVELSVSMQVSGFFRLMEFMLAGQLKKIWKGYFENLDKLASGK